MTKSLRHLGTVALLATCTARPIAAEQARQSSMARQWLAPPLAFEAVGGDEQRYRVRAAGTLAMVGPSELVLANPGSGEPVRVRIEGADRSSRPQPADPLPGRSHYLRGKDPARWRVGVPRYGRVKYPGVYPGIDLVFHGDDAALEYDFVVASGADPRRISLTIAGAGPVRLDADGHLRMVAGGRPLVQRRPVAYQETPAGRQDVEARYQLEGGRIRFALGAYDRRRPLVIDPVLGYSTYLGGAANADEAFGVAVDAQGYVYVTGRVLSADFPSTGAAWDRQCSPSNFCTDAFVAKFDPAASGPASLIYSSFLGGNGEEIGFGIAVDDAGHAYVAGKTNSTDFPTTPGSLQPVCASNPYGNCSAGFLAKLSPDGSGLVYSTHLHGGFNVESGTAGFDECAGVVVDAAGHAYVSGSTGSRHFPVTAGAFQTTHGGGRDAFLVKLDPAGATLVYGTYLGGYSIDEAHSVAVDPAGRAYVAGRTLSADYPTVNPLQATHGGGSADVFLTVLEPSGSAAVYSTYLGGGGSDIGLDVAADASGHAYVTGQTQSANFPTARPLLGSNPFSTTFGDGFVTKVAPTGDALVYSTYLGGSHYDFGSSIAVDFRGAAYVTGDTSSANFPTRYAFQGAKLGLGADAFVTKLAPAGDAFEYSTYIGGTIDDTAWSIAVDTAGNAYIAGATASGNYPTSARAYQPAHTRPADFEAFVSKVADAYDLLFADDFDSGDVGAWSAAATDGEDLSVDASAAQAGTTFGLRCTVDDQAGLYVQDDSPVNEEHYRARFVLDADAFDPGEAAGAYRTRVFVGFQEDPTQRLFALVLKRKGGLYSLLGRVRLDDGRVADTPFAALAPGPHTIEVEWRRAATPSSNDGQFALWIDGAGVGNLAGLANGLGAIDFVRLGALSVKAGAEGVLEADEFVSHRHTYIGQP